MNRRRRRITATHHGDSNLRFMLPRWSLLGGIILATVLLQAAAANAVTIETQTPPPAADTDDNSLLDAPKGNATITLQLHISDPGDDGQSGLTSGGLAIDKSVTLSEPPINLLLAKQERGASPESLVHLDAQHTVAIEDLAHTQGLPLPAQLVILTAGGIAVLFFSLALSYRQLQRPRGKRVRFGILWQAFKPICGKCGRPLSVLNEYSFQCLSCRVELGARGENGKTISPREALAKIRLKEYW